MESSESYYDVLNDLKQRLHERLEFRGNFKRQFVSCRTPREVLNNEVFVQFFHSLALPALSKECFIERVNKRDLHTFLAALIHATCSLKAARTSVAKLTADNINFTVKSVSRSTMFSFEDHSTLGSLPANREQLKELFEDTLDIDAFLRHQADLCAVVLCKGTEVEAGDDDRLPYTYEEKLGEGNYGKVYKVAVATGHWQEEIQGGGTDYNNTPRVMVRKDMKCNVPDGHDDPWDKDTEHKIMKQILGSSSRGSANIVECLGALKIGSCHSLFMPLAECDLWDYMSKKHPKRPDTKEAKAEIIRCAEGLADGLQHLHEGLRTRDFEDFVCYHLDIKPANVLIFKEVKDNRLQEIWKLSDFGVSKVKMKKSPSIQEGHLKDVFVLQPGKVDPVASATHNERGMGTYLAPEASEKTGEMRDSSDVWSLGCFISVIFSYLDDGGKGIEDYEDARMDENSKGRGGYASDRFFCGQSLLTKRVNPAVRTWHARLVRNARERDTSEGDAVKFALEKLDNRVLRIEQNQRESAKGVQEMLQKTYIKYKGSAEADNDPEERIREQSSPKSWLRRLSR